MLSVAEAGQMLSLPILCSYAVITALCAWCTWRNRSLCLSSARYWSGATLSRLRLCAAPDRDPPACLDSLRFSFGLGFLSSGQLCTTFWWMIRRWAVDDAPGIAAAMHGHWLPLAFKMLTLLGLATSIWAFVRPGLAWWHVVAGTAVIAGFAHLMDMVGLL